MIEKVFRENEMHVLKPKKDWNKEELLNAKGMYFFKDISKLLDLPLATMTHVLKEKGLTPAETWEVYGVRKVWTHWIVQMERFALIYRKELEPEYRRVPKGIDGNQLLAMQGTFLLVQVCRLIPFTTHQIRYQARQVRDSRAEMGVWKSSKNSAYLVDMETFASWVKRLWKDEWNSLDHAESSKPKKRDRTKKPPKDKR